MDPDSAATIDDINNIIDLVPQRGSEVNIGEGVVITPSQSRVTGKISLRLFGRSGKGQGQRNLFPLTPILGKAGGG